MTHDFTAEMTANESVAMANAARGIDADGLFDRALYAAMQARVKAHNPAWWNAGSGLTQEVMDGFQKALAEDLAERLSAPMWFERKGRE